MARTRDIVIGVVIATCFLLFVVIAFVGFMGVYSDDGDFFAFGDKIAIVDVKGPIYSSTDIVRQIKKYGEDNSVVAILLHINSPGGVVAPTQEIYDEILRVRMEDEKLVVASMASVAASGAYYISCATDQIVANPGTLIGSIGVILEYPVVGDLLDKLGIKYETIKSGEIKDVGSPWREPTDRDREMLQAAIDDTYDQFVGAVMEGRNMTREEVLEIADGSIFTGRQGLDLGMVDRLGSYEEAVRITAALAGIEGDPNTVKEKVRREVTIFDLLEGSFMDVFESGHPNLGPELKYLFK
jgi:protease-4